MNTGIQDAVFLGQMISEVLKNADADSVLDKYERKRRPVAQHVVSLTDQMTKMATLKNPAARFIRNMMLRLVSIIPGIRYKIAFNLAELQYK